MLSTWKPLFALPGPAENPPGITKEQRHGTRPTSKLQESSGHIAAYCVSSPSGRSRLGLQLSLFTSVSKSSSCNGIFKRIKIKIQIKNMIWKSWSSSDSVTIMSKQVVDRIHQLNSRINDRFDYFIMQFLQLQGLQTSKYFTLENKFMCVIVLNRGRNVYPLENS